MLIKPIDTSSIAGLGQLLCSEKASAGCWCMWFILPVKDYHEVGESGNRARFAEMVSSSVHPMGLLAYGEDGPLGWCAAGPRSRYARAIRTPTYRGRDAEDDQTTWLLPCLFVHKKARGSGLGEQLVRAAVDLAREHKATAIEAFPYSGHKRQSKETQVGFAPTFAKCGFIKISEPSPSRVIMRLQLQPKAK